MRASTRSAPAPPLASRQARPHLFTPLCFSPSCPFSRSVAASCSRAVLIPHDGLGQLLRARVVGPTRDRKRAAMRGTERSQQHGSRGHAGAQRGGAAPRLERKKTVTRRKVRAQARVALPPTLRLAVTPERLQSYWHTEPAVRSVRACVVCAVVDLPGASRLWRAAREGSRRRPSSRRDRSRVPPSAEKQRRPAHGCRL